MFVFRNLQASDLLNAMSEGGGPWKSLGRRTSLDSIYAGSVKINKTLTSVQGDGRN